MSHCWNPAFDYHLNHGFIVLKHGTTWRWAGEISHSKADCQHETKQDCRLGWNFGLVSRALV